MDRKKRLAGRELADLAAGYGWPPVRLTYAVWVALVLNLPRQAVRRQAIVMAGVAIAHGSDPPDGWFRNLTDDPAEAAQWEADRLLARLRADPGWSGG